MKPDPRLRLLDDPTSPEAIKVLSALDDTRVVVRSGPDMTGAHTTALAAFVAITARLFGDVTVEGTVDLTTNWWSCADTDELLVRLERVRTTPAGAPTRNLTVTFGDQVAPGSIGIGGGDFTFRVGPYPQPLEDGPQHALGVHAAACLAVSQLLIDVLGPYGFAGVRLDGPYVGNLVDYSCRPTPIPVIAETAANPALAVALAGTGSVGSSAVALLAMSLSSSVTGGRSSAACPQFTLIDDDPIDPERNPFRYPSLLGEEVGLKVDYLARRLRSAGFLVDAAPVTVAQWVQQQENPGWDGILVSSVDTISGRQDVADVLARTTLSLGISGLALHAQREGFGDGYACAYCDYVTAEPPSTQAGVYASLTGLQVSRVLTLLQDGQRLTESDVDQAVASGRVPPHRRAAMVGASVNDLVRQAYAEADLRGHPQSPAAAMVSVAAPQVSWFAGVVAAAEVVKQMGGLPLLDRRVDVDLSGLPPGLVRRVAADRSGRCLCRSGVRRRWYRHLYPAAELTAASSVPLQR